MTRIIAMKNILWKASFSVFAFDEEPVKEIRLINLTDWGWLLFIGAVILAVWILILLQAKSKEAHVYGLVAQDHINDEASGHSDEHSIPEELE